MTCTANSGRSLRHKPAVLLSTVVLFLAVLTSCSCALSSTQPHPSGTVTLDAKTIEALTRMAGQPHSPPKRIRLPGRAGSMVDVACAELTPLNLTRPIAVRLEATPVGPGDSTTVTSTCTPGVPTVDCGDAVNIDPFYAVSVKARSFAEPWHIIMSSQYATYTLEMTSDDFDSTTTACLLTRSDFDTAPQFNQTGNKLTLTTTSGNGAAGVTCFKMEAPDTPKGECCDMHGRLKGPESTCRNSSNPCTKAATCSGEAIDCPANIPRPYGTPCPWYPRPQGHPYYTDASPLTRTAATEEEATALLMSAKPAYGWPECEGKCIDGQCALRMDHPTCCTAPHSKGHYGHYNAAADADPEAAKAHVSGGTAWQVGR